jgi:hypothetical protein
MKAPGQDKSQECPGAWWPAGEPDKQKIGRLKIDPAGDAKLTLEMLHQRTADEALLGHVRQQGKMDRAMIFHGHDEDGKPFTLLGCVKTNTHTATAYSTETYNVAMVVKGRHYASRDEIKLDEVYLDFAYLQEWLERRGVRINQQEDGKFVVDKPSGEERVSPTGQGYSVVLQSGLGSESNAESVCLSSRELLSFRFDKPWAIERVQELIVDFQWLLTLAAGSPVPVVSITGLSNDWQITMGDNKACKPMDVFMRWPGWDTSRRSPHRSEMLFTVSAFADGLGPALARWREYRQKHAAVLACYFSTIFNEHLYENHEFLFLAHALELYHQKNFDGARQPPAEFKARLEKIVAAVPGEAEWLHGKLGLSNNKNLAERLIELVSARQSLLGGLVPDVARFAKRVKDTRHYYTHWNEDLRRDGRVAEGEELFRLTEAMRALLEVSFLQDLGISLAAINKVTKPRGTYIKLF